jgi:phosphoribosylaminoimidazole-succinocarboxamide synthase
VEIVGADLAARIRDISIAIYKAASEFAATKGIIIADTKFEFGLDRDGTLVLMDEVLTPDSSRYWPDGELRLEGRNPPSYDKQFLRDWLEQVPRSTASPGSKTPAGAASAARGGGEHRRQVPRGAAAADGLKLRPQLSTTLDSRRR